ncbi:MAG: YdcF family protein [Fimbriimonadaceae bacterium]|jgi:SanA protein|nr:YdcF family protein [Fimbriimonadaceae bacterium]
MTQPSRRWLKILWRCIWIPAVLLVGLTLLGNGIVTGSTSQDIYHSVNSVPENQVAIVLGTSPRSKGEQNPFFANRIEAAADLYQAGKVKKLILSGHETAGYSEPRFMQAALLRRGVPASALVLDPEGHRTLFSVARAREVYGQDRLTIVTDDFHLARSLFVARAKGIDAVGFSSQPVSWRVSFWVRFREVGARLKMFSDLAFAPSET